MTDNKRDKTKEKEIIETYVTKIQPAPDSTRPSLNKKTHNG